MIVLGWKRSGRREVGGGWFELFGLYMALSILLDDFMMHISWYIFSLCWLPGAPRPRQASHNMIIRKGGFGQRRG